MNETKVKFYLQMSQLPFLCSMDIEDSLTQSAAAEMCDTGYKETDKAFFISKLKGHVLLTVGQCSHFHFTSKSFHAPK